MYKGNKIPRLRKEEIKAVSLLARNMTASPSQYASIELPSRIHLIAEWARYHDVVPQILVNAQKAVEFGISRFLEWMDQFREACGFDTWMELLREHNKEVLQLVTELSDHGLPFLVVKGQNLQPFYEESLRFQRDIDILCPDLKIGWEVFRCLSRIGYMAEKVKLGIGRSPSGKNSASTCFYLLAPMTRVTDDGLELSIDLHAGAYPICGEVSLSCTLLFGRQESVLFDGSSVAIPSPSREDSLLIVCAHACQHWLVTFRDINDFYVLAREHGLIDWEYVVETAFVYGMIPVLIQIASLAEGLYGCELVPSGCRRMQGKGRIPHTCELFAPRRYFPVLCERFRYLVRANSRLVGSCLLGLLKATKALHYLIRNNEPWYDPINNRSFPIYKHRKIQPLAGSRQIVLDEVTKIPATALKKLVRKTQGLHRKGTPRVRRITANCLVINEGREDEVFITSAGVFAQCGYEGHLAMNEKNFLSTCVSKLLST